MSDGLTSFQQAELHARYAHGRAAELGLTAQDIRNMDWNAWHRLISADRPTPAQMALAEYKRQQDSRSASPAPGSTPTPTNVPVTASGPDRLTDPAFIASLSPEEFARLREQLRAANSPGTGVNRNTGHVLNEANVERPKVSSREDIAHGLQAARDAEAARLAWLRGRSF
jgi:hypothetical protein